jgi:hypothetical protein
MSEMFINKVLVEAAFYKKKEKRYRYHCKIIASEILDTTTNYQSAMGNWFPGFGFL